MAKQLGRDVTETPEQRAVTCQAEGREKTAEKKRFSVEVISHVVMETGFGPLVTVVKGNDGHHELEQQRDTKRQRKKENAALEQHVNIVT